MSDSFTLRTDLQQLHAVSVNLVELGEERMELVLVGRTDAGQVLEQQHVGVAHGVLHQSFVPDGAHVKLVCKHQTVTIRSGKVVHVLGNTRAQRKQGRTQTVEIT